METFWCHNCNCVRDLLQVATEQWVCFACGKDDLTLIEDDDDDDDDDY